MKYCLILGVCLFVSCVSGTKGKQEALNLLPSDSLKVEVGSPTLIKKVGNQLFVNNSFSGNYCMDAIDITNDSILYSFAMKGQGPDEFLQIASMDVYCQNSKWYLLLFDNLKRECVSYSIDSLNYYKGDCSPIERLKLSPSSRYLEIYRLKDFYITSGRTAKKFAILGKENLDYVGSCMNYLVGNTSDTDSMTISKANYGRQYVSNSGDKILSTVFMSGTMSLYAVDADSVRKEWDYTSSNFDYRKDGNFVYQQSLTGYIAAGFFGNKVLGLYSGEKKESTTNYGNEFHLLDMKGHLLRKYLVSSYPYNFCIDTSDSLIYAISYSSVPKIVIYNMKDMD